MKSGLSALKADIKAEMSTLTAAVSALRAESLMRKHHLRVRYYAVKSMLYADLLMSTSIIIQTSAGDTGPSRMDVANNAVSQDMANVDAGTETGMKCRDCLLVIYITCFAYLHIIVTGSGCWFGNPKGEDKSGCRILLRSSCSLPIAVLIQESWDVPLWHWYLPLRS